jgi:cell division protease FtsH
MIAHWGMSDAIGPAAFRNSEEHPFLGKEIMEQRQYSDETARIIDQEIQRFLNEAQERAGRLISEHRDKLDKVAEALLTHEILDREALTLLIGPPQPRKYLPVKQQVISAT